MDNLLIKRWWFETPLTGRHSLKRKSRHFDNIFITVWTGSCQNNNQCSQWRRFYPNNISVSALWCPDRQLQNSVTLLSNKISPSQSKTGAKVDTRVNTLYKSNTVLILDTVVNTHYITLINCCSCVTYVSVELDRRDCEEWKLGINRVPGLWTYA